MKRTSRAGASRSREQVSALVSSGVDASRLELFREMVGIGSVEFVELHGCAFFACITKCLLDGPIDGIMSRD